MLSLDLTSDFLQFTIAMPRSSKNGDYAFDGFSLDPEKLMLYRDGREISLPVKVVKTLSVLIENRGTILSKDELIDKVWSDSIVEESNLSQNLYILRKTLGDRPDGGSYIETLRRRGYRFNAAVKDDSRSAAVRTAPAAPRPAFDHPEIERQGNVLRFVDKRELASPLVVEPIAAEAAPAAADSRTPRTALYFAGVSVVALMVSAFMLFGGSSSNAVENKRAEMSVVRLTDGAWPSGATIDPEGGYFAYIEIDGDVSRVYVQQVGQSNRLEISASAESTYQYLTFSNNGRFVYITAADKSGGRASLLRVPSIGGPAVRILEQMSGIVSFSPDGKELAFSRVREDSQEWSIMIADAEGKNQRTLVSRSEPSRLGGSPSWSPDGKLIAVSEWSSRPALSKFSHRLSLIDVSTGRVRELSPEDWGTLYRLAWTSDGKGVVMVATRWNETYSTRRDQLYFVSYPDGRSHRVTSDGNRYEPGSLGVSKSGSVVAVSSNRSSQLWTLDASGDEKSAYQISRGSADGRAGLSALADGRIAYISRSGDELKLWIANSLNADQKQLAVGLGVIEEVRTDRAGKFMIFSALSDDGKHHIFRIDTDGKNLKQLTFDEGYEVDSDISPDGSMIVYAAARRSAWGENFRLQAIPSDGGGSVRFGSIECDRPTFSPDGKKLSCVTVSDEVVILTSDGHEIERSKLTPNVTSNFGIGWLPDSSALAVIRLDNGISNIWSYPMGGGKPKRLTNFKDGIIYRYTFSLDGTRLFLARGYPTQDAVMITSYR